MEPGDVELLYGWENTPEVWQYSSQRWPVSRSAIEHLVAEGEKEFFASGQLRLMIEQIGTSHIPEAGEMDDLGTVGCIDLYDGDLLNAHAGLGLLIALPFRRQGFGRAAVQQMARYATRSLGLSTLEARVGDDNEASLALFRSCGWRHVGILKGWNAYDHQRCDEHIFQYISR